MARRHRVKIKRGRRGFTNPPDSPAVIPTFEWVDEGEAMVTPFGRGLALIEGALQLEESGLWLRVEVRDDRPQLVAIESRDTEFPITASSLRFALDDAVKALIGLRTVRLERDPETGAEVGVPIRSLTGAGDVRSLSERTAIVEEHVKRPKGRPRLSDEFLQEVLDEWDECKKLGEAAAEKLGDRYRVAPATVRQWTSKARSRGLAPKEV